MNKLGKVVILILASLGLQGLVIPMLSVAFGPVSFLMSIGTEAIIAIGISVTLVLVAEYFWQKKIVIHFEGKEPQLSLSPLLFRKTKLTDIEDLGITPRDKSSHITEAANIAPDPESSLVEEIQSLRQEVASEIRVLSQDVRAALTKPDRESALTQTKTLQSSNNNNASADQVGQALLDGAGDEQKQNNNKKRVDILLGTKEVTL